MTIDWVDVRDRIEALHMEISAAEGRLVRGGEDGGRVDCSDYRTVVGLESLLLSALALADAHAGMRSLRN